MTVCIDRCSLTPPVRSQSYTSIKFLSCSVLKPLIFTIHFLCDPVTNYLLFQIGEDMDRYGADSNCRS